MNLRKENPRPAKFPLPSLLVLSFAFIICPASAPAQEATGIQDYSAIFSRANNFYKEEKYDAAIQDYEQLIIAGVRSANILYNLANAHLRAGNKGKAVLYYERALMMCPRDADIRSNLNFARALVEGIAGYHKKQWYERVFFFLRSFLAIDDITIITSALYFAIVSLMAVSVIFRGKRKVLQYSAGVFCLLLIVVLPSFISGIYESEFQSKAVIMTGETTVRFEPDDDATVHFKLYEGAVIQIIRSQEGWHLVKRGDGKMGWLRSDLFAII